MSEFPYPGLRPFRRDETDIFFGREGQVDQLLERLDKNRFLAILGPSGCGKSSLLEAGMLASLEAGFMASAGVRWRIANMRPGQSPMRDLAKNLLEDKALGPEWGEHKENVAFLQAILRRGPLGLLEALKEAPLPKGANLLILVDQFEEIFRYRQQYGADEAEAFVSLLLNSARQREVSVYVVIAMRTDFLSDCNLLSGLADAINEGQFLIPRLDREQSREAIVGPAEVFGGKVEPALVNRLLNDMQKDPDQLPLMQHALMRIWNIALARGTASPALSLGDYEAIGGLEEALSNHADEAFGELDERQKAIVETLFRSLCERSPTTRDTRRPTRLSDVAAVAGVDPDEVAKVVEVFRQPDRSFLMPPVGTPLLPETIIDISHESLIRQWKRLNGWVEAEATSAGEYHRLEQTARLWKGEVAELWSGLDLQKILDWKEYQHPAREWAKRYGADFDLAMEFLDESQKHLEEEKKREEAARQRELKLKQTKHRLALTLIALAIALGMAFWAYSKKMEVQREREIAQQAREDVEKTANLMRVIQLLSQASLQARGANYNEAHKTLEDIFKISRKLDQPTQTKLRYAKNLLDWFINLMSDRSTQIYKGKENVFLCDVAVSPDGHLLAAIGDNDTVVLFDTDKGNILWQLQRPPEEGRAGKWHGLAFHPKGKWLVTSRNKRDIVLLALPDGKELGRWSTTHRIVLTLALSPTGRLLATGGTDSDIIVWDVETKKVWRTLKGHKDWIKCLAFSPDGKLLASASFDYTVRIWDLKRGKSSSILSDHEGCVYSVAFDPDGRILATGGEDRNIRLWEINPDKPELKCLLKGHIGEIEGLVFLNSRYLASASFWDNCIRVWDVKLSKELGLGITARRLQAPRVFRLAEFDGQLFSASSDSTVCRWNPLKRILENKEKGITDFSEDMRIVDCGTHDEPRSCAIAPDGSTIAVRFSNGKLRLYTLPDFRSVWEKSEIKAAGKEEEEEKVYRPVVNRLAFSPDGQNLASASSADADINLWQVNNGQLKQTFQCRRGEGIWGIGFSPDGKLLAAASSDVIVSHNIGIFEIGKEKGYFFPSDTPVNSVVFDRSGHNLVSAGDDGKARLWDVKRDMKTQQLTLNTKWTSPVSNDNLYRAAFSPDGNRIGLGGFDTLVYILKSINGKKEKQLADHQGLISGIDFSPDGGLAATISGRDATIRLWELTFGTELFTLPLLCKTNWPFSVTDFDFHWPSKKQDCWIAVPLTESRKLVLYHIGHIYD